MLTITLIHPGAWLAEYGAAACVRPCPLWAAADVLGMAKDNARA